MTPDRTMPAVDYRPDSSRMKARRFGLGEIRIETTVAFVARRVGADSPRRESTGADPVDRKMLDKEEQEDKPGSRNELIGAEL